MIYIQSNDERTLPHHFDAACAMYGAMDSALDYRLTSYGEIQSGKFDFMMKSNLFVGSVEFMKEVYNRQGIEYVPMRNSNRDGELCTLKEVKDRVAVGHKVFIKPLETKLFTGFVLDRATYSSIAGLEDNTKVLAYTPFTAPIESEYRCYVHENKIVDMKHYAGNNFVYPFTSYLIKVLHENTRNHFPVAYTMDVGVLSSGETVVVEFNDMWAIGNYGIPNDLYLRLLKARYFQIVLNRP